MNAKTAHQIEVNKIKSFIKQVDSKRIVRNKDEIQLFAISRNESLRLPHFINYYNKLGVDRIFLIDNNSTDSTVEIALSYNNVHVFSIDRPYRSHWYWMEYFLKEYAIDNWCLVVDIDELISYPNIESVSLKKLANYLETQSYGAIRCLLLDLYADKPLAETGYLPQNNPLDFCQFFDADFEKEEIVLFDKNKWKPFVTSVYTGGMRDRVFGKNLPPDLRIYRRLPYHLSKISFFKKTKNNYLTQGMHAINGSDIADIEGVVFHTKFMQDFISEVMEEVQREEHFDNAILYKIFYHTLITNPMISLWDPKSVKLIGPQQLYDLKILKTSKKYERFVQQ